MRLHPILGIDVQTEIDHICAWIRSTLIRFHRRGVVVGISGGIDSATTAALCARAIGPERVFGLLMPERESSPSSTALGEQVADSLGIRHEHRDITDILEAYECYMHRDEIVKRVVSDYDGEGFKIAIEANPDGVTSHFVLVANVATKQVRSTLQLHDYLALIAATNHKQRVRKTVEYYHADLYNYAVAGTPNRLEYDQGFFVKLGDGSADLKPIAHLYKSQVYEVARELGVPEAVIETRPTTDTYSIEQSQEEFYFGVDLRTLDICMYGLNNGVATTKIARYCELTASEVEQIVAGIEQKRRSTRALHVHGALARPVPEVG